jgi:hypothetical protein
VAYQVQIRGDWAGVRGGWRPAVDGTINQTGMSRDAASTAPTRAEAEALAEAVVEAGAAPADVRVVEVAE